MANATAGVVSLHGTGMCAGARDMVRLGTVRCCYRARRWGPVTCAAPSGIVTEDVVSKPRRLPRVVGMGSKLIACGSAVPEFEISNDDLAKIVETSDEWISVRTGIRKRRVLTGKESLKGLAVAAGKKALAMAQVEPDEIDLVIMCTSTSNDLFGTGAQVHTALGCKNAWAFDATATCSGFIVGLVTATRFIKGGGYQNVLVIGADCLSRHVDWTDRGTCILFGDGAGAVLVQATAAEDDGFLGFDIHSDGQGYRHINAKTSEGGMEEVIANTNGSTNFPPKKPALSFVQMNGKEVFRFAVRCVPQSIKASLEEAALTSSNIDWLLC